jgi:hypothetical protein
MQIAVKNCPVFYCLGRTSNLQGLAASMIKLWERCEVAKIAMKRGSHCIDSELVSEELKVGSCYRFVVCSYTLHFMLSSTYFVVAIQ